MRDALLRTLREICGLDRGFSHGRGGSMHLQWLEAGAIGTNAIVGGGVPLAAGSAWAHRHAGTDAVSVTYFGDGATNIGSTLETFNLAGAWKLPICFFVENNQYAVSTHVAEVTAEPRLSGRGPGFGIPSWKVDGMDPLAVHLAMQEALAHMRAGNGPTLIEADVYRYFHQNGPFPGSAFRYRSKEEEAEWRGRDPIDTTARHLVRRGILTQDDVDATIARAKELMAELGEVILEPKPGGKPKERQIKADEWPDPAFVDTGVRGDLSELEGITFTDESDHAGRLVETKFIDAVAGVMGRRLETDPRVVVMGEDVHRLNGGTNGATRGLKDAFPDRVLGTPISENAFTGLGGGMALDGRFRPVVEFMYADFMWVAADQLFNQIGKARHMFGGDNKVPFVLRSKVAMGTGYGSQHSMDPAGIFATAAGWRIVAPSTPFDYVGLMNTALALRRPGGGDRARRPLHLVRRRPRRRPRPLPARRQGGRAAYRIGADDPDLWRHDELRARCGRRDRCRRRRDRPALARPREPRLGHRSARASRRPTTCSSSSRERSVRRTAAGSPTRSSDVSSTGSTPRSSGSPEGSRRRASARCSSGPRSRAARKWPRSWARPWETVVPEILRMPEVAAGATEAVLSTWNVAVGAEFAAGEAIVTVETDKAVVDVEAESGGVMLRQLVADGSHVEVGSPIAVYSAVGETVDDLDAFLAGIGVAAAAGETAAATPEATVAGSAPASAPATAESAAAADESGARVFASPLARKLARDAGLDLAGLAGSGPGGRIRRRDVEAHLAAAPTTAGAAAPRRVVPVASSDAEFVDVPNTRLRNAIAARLAESKQTAPHFYLRGTARVDRLLALRSEINAGAGPKVSVNDLVVKAVGRAHTLVPDLNVIWTGDAIRHFSQVDVSVAVATENGLVTPVVRGVDRLSLHQLVATTQDLIVRAKDKKLQQSELEGGTISVTNLGMFGTEEFAAIINPPQAAIIAVGAARPEPVVLDGALAVATVMRVTLSVDHRPVDGATAAQWMKVFVELLENPAQILV